MGIEEEGGGGGGGGVGGEDKEGMQLETTLTATSICHVMGAKVCTFVSFSSIPSVRGWNKRKNITNNMIKLPV
jgi:hypothetical protein